MFDIVLSYTPKEEAPATMDTAMRLLIALGLAFLGMLVVIWLVILLTRLVKRHASAKVLNLDAAMNATFPKAQKEEKAVDAQEQSPAAAEPSQKDGE